LSQFDRTKGFFINYTPDFFNPNSLSSNNVFTICEDKLDYIWIGTYGGGLNRFDRREKKFKRYMVDPQNTYSLSDNFVWSIYEDHAGVLWIGTENGGLNQFDRDNNRFLRYQADPEDSNSLSSNKILCILEDRSGMLWLGTTNGLDKFNRVDKRFIHYTKDDGLPSNAIQSLLEDDHGNLWLGTLKGLSKFDPRTGKCINYKVSDGLQSNEFNVNACFKSQSGEMYFGGLNGFNIFSPDSIKNNPYIPPIVITNIQIFNKSVLIGKEIDGRIILKNSVTETKEIKLSYKENVFSFEFAALHYVSPENNQYAYMMEGFDKDWNYTDANKRYVTYTNMGGGEYVFRVKGSNSDGVWNEEGASIRIIISPPFWQTIWFYGFLALLVVCGAFWIYKRREQIRDLAEKKRIEEVIAKERNLLRTLIDNIPDAIYVKDTDSRKVIATVADVHNMGLQLEAEVLGKDDFELFPKDMAERFFADDQSVIQTGKSVVNREEYVLDEKGKKRWLLTSKIPLHDKNGHIIGLVGIGKDITNRKLIEEALHESEERFRIIAEQTGQLVYDYQLDSGVIKYAGAIQEVTGYSSNDIQDSIISDWREKIHPEDRDSVISFLEEARKTSSHYLIEYRYRRINGEYIYVEDRGVFINNELGAAQRVLGAIENITERKRTALERESLINKLQNALADVKTLSGLVPICSNCKKIRDDKGYWNQLEGFIQEHSLARFSHGICPDCMKKLYPDFMARK
jgi:PAS domain S-box-containing protein